MELMKNPYDLDLEEKEKQIRDGIFNLDTIRFGRIPEIMIKKLYQYEYSGTNKYDLKTGNTKIEVKFSCVNEKEDTEITEKNVLEICSANSNVRERSVSIKNYSEKNFDRNIEQIKPSFFDILYYGLFFSDQIIIFKIKSELLKYNFQLSKFNNTKGKGKRLSRIKKLFLEISEKEKNDTKHNSYENKRNIIFVKKRISEIKTNLEDLLSFMKENNELASSYNDYLSIEEFVQLLDFDLDELKTTNEMYKISKDLHKKFNSSFETYRIPNLSPNQHAGNDQNNEGQFHITNKNIDWHLENNFIRYLSYKDLIILLTSEEENGKLNASNK